MPLASEANGRYSSFAGMHLDSHGRCMDTCSLAQRLMVTCLGFQACIVTTMAAA